MTKAFVRAAVPMRFDTPGGNPVWHRIDTRSPIVPRQSDCDCEVKSTVWNKIHLSLHFDCFTRRCTRSWTVIQLLFPLTVLHMMWLT